MKPRNKTIFLHGVAEKNDGTTTIMYGGFEFRRVRKSDGKNAYWVGHMKMFCELFRCKYHDKGYDCKFYIMKTIHHSDGKKKRLRRVSEPFYFRLSSSPHDHDTPRVPQPPPPPPPQPQKHDGEEKEEQTGEESMTFEDFGNVMDLFPEFYSITTTTTNTGVRMKEARPTPTLLKKRKFIDDRHPLDESGICGVHPSRGKSGGGEFVEIFCLIKQQNKFMESFQQSKLRVLFLGQQGHTPVKIMFVKEYLEYPLERRKLLERFLPQQTNTVILVCTPCHSSGFVDVCFEIIDESTEVVCRKLNRGFEYIREQGTEQQHSKKNDDFDDDFDDEDDRGNGLFSTPSSSMSSISNIPFSSNL